MQTATKKPQPTNTEKVKSFLWTVVILIILFFVVKSCVFGDDKPEGPDTSKMTQSQIDSIKHVKFITDQFSAWDGSHFNSVLAIKDKMNDPDSFEHVKTTYKESGNKLIVFTKFRGKNTFGGVVTQTFVTRTDSTGAIEFISEFNQ